MTITQKTKRQKEYLRWKGEWEKRVYAKEHHFTFAECQDQQWCDMCTGGYTSSDGELKIRCDCECHKE